MDSMNRARKFIEEQGATELKRLQRIAKEENTPEGNVIYNLVQSELERRKLKELYLKGRITREQLSEEHCEGIIKRFLE